MTSVDRSSKTVVQELAELGYTADDTDSVYGRAVAEIERLTRELEDARSIADQAHSLIDSMREEHAADLAKAYDTGHHHCALGITEIPTEYRGAVEPSKALADCGCRMDPGGWPVHDSNCKSLKNT